MRIFVKVKTGAKQQRIEKIDESHFRLSVKSLPQKGKANEEVIHVLAEYFSVPKGRIKILSGFGAKHKCIEIM